MVTLLCSIWSVVGVLIITSLAVMTIHNNRKDSKWRKQFIKDVKELKQAVDEAAAYMEVIKK